MSFKVRYCGATEMRRLLEGEHAHAIQYFRRGLASPLAGRFGAQDGHQYSLGDCASTSVREKPVDLVEQRVLIAHERKVIVTGKFDEACTRNQARDVAPFFHMQAPIAGT